MLPPVPCAINMITIVIDDPRGISYDRRRIKLLQNCMMINDAFNNHAPRLMPQFGALLTTVEASITIVI